MEKTIGMELFMGSKLIEILASKYENPISDKEKIMLEIQKCVYWC